MFKYWDVVTDIFRGIGITRVGPEHSPWKKFKVSFDTTGGFRCISATSNWQVIGRCWR
jgi:hypothetical protein